MSRDLALKLAILIFFILILIIGLANIINALNRP